MRTSLIRAAVVGAVFALSVAGCKKAKDPETAAPTEGAAPTKPSASANEGAAAAAATGSAEKNPEGCNSDLSQNFVADVTLTEKCSPYTASREFGVDGYTLTIDPGVELRFKEGAMLAVAYNARARLVVKGTPEKPVKFVSESRKEPGAWKGIGIYERGTDSVIENAIIENAGLDDAPALLSDASGLTLKNVKFVAVKGLSLKLTNDAPAKSISGLDVTQAGSEDTVADLSFANATAFGTDNRYGPTSVLAVHGNVGRDVTLTKQALAWRLLGEANVDADTGKTATLTLEAGVTLQFSEEGGLWFGYSGAGSAALKVKGTAEQPVVFTRFGEDLKTTPAKGLGFYRAARAPEIDYAVFEYLGRQDGAAVVFDDARGLGRITHSTFRNVPGKAIEVRSARERFAAFESNTFSSVSGSALVVPLDLAEGIAPSNTFEKTWVELTGKTNRDTTLAALSAPYHVSGELAVEAEDGAHTATLTLEAGTTLLFNPEGSLSVGYNQPAKLVAKGTAGKPVTLDALSDDWGGVWAYDRATLDLDTVTISKVREASPGLTTAEKTQGTVKNVTFQKTKHGLKKCSTQVQSSGLKADKGVKAEEPC